MCVLYVTAVFIEGIMPVNRYLSVCMCADIIVAVFMIPI